MTTPQIVNAPRALRRSSAAVSSARARAIKNFLVAMLFLSPSLLIFIPFVFVPMLNTIQRCLYLADLTGRMAAFSWHENYPRVFANKDLYDNLRVSVAFTISA